MRRVLAAAGLGLALTPAAPALASPIEVQAHRGGPYVNRTPRYPENSMAAFRHAVARGFVLELDVKLTRDRVPVVIHDAELERTTNCTGEVASLTAAELARRCRLNVLGVPENDSGLPIRFIRRSRHKVPTLAQVLGFARDREARVNLEIKNVPSDPDFDPGPGFADRVIDALVRSRIPRSLVQVQSFLPTNLDRVEARLPAVETSFLTLRQVNSIGPSTADSRGYEWVSPGWPVSGAYVSEAHARGLRVVPYTLDRAADIRAAAAAAVDELISNDPDTARRVLSPLGPPRPAVPPPPTAAQCRSTRARRHLPPVETYDAKPGAPRVFAMQFKQEVRHVVSYASFRRKVECLIREYVLPRRSRTRPNVVAFNEDIGLMTIATGSRGRAARDVFSGPGTPSALAGLTTVGAAYSAQAAAYRARFPELPPLGGTFVSATDTFARGWMQTFSDLARRYGVYILGSNNQARFRESTDPAEIAAFADPDLPRPRSVYVATDTKVFNEVFMWGPRDVRRAGPRPLRNVVARNKKLPLTQIEEAIQLEPGPARGPDAVENVEPYRLPRTRARISFATSLPAFVFGDLPRGVNPCSDTSRWYMRCLDRLGVNLVIQDEANPGQWATYTAPGSPDRGAWQPLSWMTSTWRHVADRSVRFAYNVTPHMVGNLGDLPFDGQTAITQRGLGARPVSISAAARRRCNYVGARRFVAGSDPAQMAIGGETLGTRQFAGPKTEFLALAPWVVPDGPRAGLERVADELGPAGNGPRENDYVETAVVADLPFPPNPRRRSCARGPLRGKRKLRLTVSPRRVRAGTRRRFRLRVTALVFGERRAIGGATVRIAGRRVRTGRRGRASIVLRFATPGLKRARATRRGYRADAAAVSVLAPPRLTG